MFDRLKKSFARRHYFDEDIPEDVEEVLDVAAMLEIKEFDVFRAAFNWWHGGQSTEQQIEPYFSNYMFHSIVPPWVRQFTRMALRLKSEGRLDRHELGIHRLPDATPQTVARGVRYAVLLVTVVATLVFLANAAQHLLQLRCLLPPCY